MEAEKLVYCSSSGERGWRVESGYYLFLMYLFIFGCMRAFSCCSRQRLTLLWCVGFSLQWLLLLGAQALGSVGPEVVVLGLCSLMVCGIFLDYRSNSCPLHCKVDS